MTRMVTKLYALPPQSSEARTTSTRSVMEPMTTASRSATPSRVLPLSWTQEVLGRALPLVSRRVKVRFPGAVATNAVFEIVN